MRYIHKIGLFFGQQPQVVFVHIGSSHVIMVINVSIDTIDVMEGEIAMMAVMNGIVVCIIISYYDETLKYSIKFQNVKVLDTRISSIYFLKQNLQ